MPKENPKHFIRETKVGDYTYYYEAWYVPDRKSPIKKRIYDANGKSPTSKKQAEFILWGRANGQAVTNDRISMGEFMPLFEKYLRDKGEEGEKHRSIQAEHYSCYAELTPLYPGPQEVGYRGFYKLSAGAPATKTKYAKSLCRLYKIADILGKIDKNPMKGYEYTKYKKIINPYTEAEIQKLIRVSMDLRIESNEPYDVFIILALQTGLRLDEYVNMRWKNLDWKKGEYHIKIDDTWRPKHDHERIIRIPRHSLDLLKSIWDGKDEGYIFYRIGKRGDNRGKRIKHHHFTRDFANALFKASGLEGDLHQVRKTFASYRLAIEGNLYAIKEHLGHTSLKEVEAYIGKVHSISDNMRELFGVPKL